MQIVTQQEITTAYLRGIDINEIIDKRARQLRNASIIVSVITLYVVKSFLGIDLFGDFHAAELFSLLP
jgi:hypothetical protein